MQEFFAVSSGTLPWGDYGRVLWNGLARRESPGGAVKLSRTGPYVPPLTKPMGEIIVVDSLRRELEAGGYSGFGFSEVQYEKVVRIDWHTWDADALEPLEYPGTGGPEDYILSGSHDPSLLAEMPTLWAIEVPPIVGLQVPGSATFLRDRHPGKDIAREEYLFWVSDRLKSALEKSAAGTINFTPVVPR
jgi:hypothetical protein